VEVQVLSSALIARSPARLRSGHDDFARYRSRGQASLSGDGQSPPPRLGLFDDRKEICPVRHTQNSGLAVLKSLDEDVESHPGA
jgi:hypothetical protein